MTRKLPLIDDPTCPRCGLLQLACNNRHCDSQLFASNDVFTTSKRVRYGPDRVFAMIAAEGDLTIGGFELARAAVEVIEALAIAVIAVGVVVSISAGLYDWFRVDGSAGFETFKRNIARGLLVGLDLLIAADVIKTVTLDETVESALVLGLLVTIRTFLSWTLVLEVEGRWPWQRRGAAETK